MPRNRLPIEVDRRVREAGRNRCGYCLSPQYLVMARLEIEHIIGCREAVNLTSQRLTSRTSHTLITTLPKWLPLSMCLSAATASANSKTRSITGCNWLTRIA